MNELPWFLALLMLVPFYLLGAYPTGFLIARSKGFDIRQLGSGNVGATNVARTIGPRAALFTLVGDIAKGLGAILLARLVAGPDLWPWCGAATVAGHCFSIPGKLRGGKGVATSLGVVLLLSPGSAILSVLVFVLTLGIWRFVSLGSVCAAFSVPLFAALYGVTEPTLAALACISGIVLLRHRSNLQRLIVGTEKKFQCKTRNS